MNRLKIIFTLFVICICSYANADDNINRRISAAYTALFEKGDFSDEDFHYLTQIPEATLTNSPDSVKYQYHYLICYGLDSFDGDVDDKIYHISQAIKLIETKTDVLTYGIYEIDYLWLSKALAECYEEKGDYQRAILQYERTLIRGESVLKNNSNVNLRDVKSGCLCGLGKLYLEVGYEREGIKCLEDAFEISKVDYEPGETTTYFPQFLLAIHYFNKKDYRKSIEEWNKLISFFASQNATKTKDNAQLYFYLGNAYNENKDYQQAISTYLKGISLHKEIGSSKDYVENLYGNLLCTYAECGDIESLNSSLDEYQDLLFSQDKQAVFYKRMYALSTILPVEKHDAIRDRIMQGFSRLNPSQQADLMIEIAYENLDENPSQSIIVAQQAIDMLKINGYVDKAAEFMFHLKMAKSFASQNLHNFEQAIYEAQQSLEYLYKCSNYTDEDKQKILYRIADLYIEVANYEKVIETTKMLIPLTIQVYGEKSQQYISSKTLLGIAYLNVGGNKKAIDIFKDLGSISLSVEGERSDGYATCLHNLGRAYMLQGDKEKAVELLEKAKGLQLEVNYAINPKTEQYLNELGIYE